MSRSLKICCINLPSFISTLAWRGCIKDIKTYKIWLRKNPFLSQIFINICFDVNNIKLSAGPNSWWKLYRQPFVTKSAFLSFYSSPSETFIPDSSSTNKKRSAYRKCQIRLSISTVIPSFLPKIWRYQCIIGAGSREGSGPNNSFQSIRCILSRGAGRVAGGSGGWQNHKSNMDGEEAGASSVNHRPSIREY